MGTLYRNGVPYIGGGSGSEEASQIHYDNTKSGIPSTSVQGAIDELNDDLTSLDSTTIETFDGATAVNVASGNPATVSNATNENAVGVTTTFEPSQDLHGYDHPWAGGAGKNLINVNDIVVLYSNGQFKSVTISDDGTGVIIEGINGAVNNAFAYIKIFEIKSEHVGKTYTISVGAISDTPAYPLSIGICGIDGTGRSRKGTTYTISQEDVDKCLVYVIYTKAGDFGAAVTYTEVQCELGSSYTTFEPYSNICPITGRTSVDVTRTGKNKAPMMKNATSITKGITVTVGDDGVVTANGTNTGSAGVIGQSEFAMLKAGSYILSGSTAENTGVTVQAIKDVGDTITALVRDSTGKGSEFTLEEDALVAVRGYISAGADVNDLKLYPMIRLASISDSSYEPYQEQYVTVNLGQTVYGGILDVTTGKLTVKTANIAAYNGETIGEPWWSSLDEYVPGTAPTTGAQVVYTLATPTTVSLTPAQIQLLTGTNVISTSADDLLVRYYVSGKSNVEGSLTYLSDEIATLDADKTDYFNIANDTDLNTLLASGVYRSPNTTALVAALANCPVGTPFTMLVTGSGKTTLGCVQTIFTDNYIYVRRGNTGGFLRWVLFVSDGVGLTVQFPSTGWTTTETVNGATYYTQTVSVTSVSGNPIVSIVPLSGTLPTSAEQKAFDSVSYFTANDTTNTIKAYAETAPSDTFAVVVKGAR